MLDARAMRAATTLTDGAQPMLGRFEYVVDRDVWRWSDSTFEIFGFQPGEVVPTTALVLSHASAVDDGALDRVLRSALDQVGAFCHCAHLLDAEDRLRTVVVAGQTDADALGRPARMHGCLIDITEPRRTFTRADVAEAVDNVVASRWTIEQAKGVLVATCGVDADTAFELLVQISQERNVKVRELAAWVLSVLEVTAYDEVARTRARDRLRLIVDEAAAEASTGA